jgi:acetyl esterase/lipase
MLGTVTHRHGYCRKRILIMARRTIKTVTATACLVTAMAVSAKPMDLRDYMALSGPAPTVRIVYGDAPSQFAELFVPPGPGPFPVAVLVHGGCWTAKFGGIVQMRNMAGVLMAHGIAVWNVEYRRLDEDGGGYPGTYLDMNAATDKLASVAGQYRLDVSRIVAIGHSAGGQLVQWMAGRGRIAPSSPLYQARPLPIRHVVSLGGLADLRREGDLIRSSCEVDVGRLTGSASKERPDVFSDTNAGDLMPNGNSTVLLTGELDTVSPPRVAKDYAKRARAAGDRATSEILPGASHYDEVATTSSSWERVFAVIRQALGLP